MSGTLRRKEGCTGTPLTCYRRAYNITSDPYGIGGWLDEQIADYLIWGHASGRGSATDPMAKSLADSLQYPTADDTTPVVAYLRRVQSDGGLPGMRINPGRAPSRGVRAPILVSVPRLIRRPRLAA
jgi:hypothetical protein